MKRSLKKKNIGEVEKDQVLPSQVKQFCAKEKNLHENYLREKNGCS